MKRFITVLVLFALVLTLAACGGKKAETAASANLSEVFAKLTLGDEMMNLTQDDLLDLYGIKAEDVKQFAGAVNTSGIKCDEIVLVEAANADAASRVKAALDTRYQSKLNENEDYLPEQYAIIKQCSVETNGNFVTMIVGPDAAAWTQAFKDALK